MNIASLLANNMPGPPFPIWAIFLIPFAFLAIVATVIIIVVVTITKRRKEIGSVAGRVSNIFNKALDNIEGELDKHKPEKVVMVNCPFCKTPNKSTDKKCSGCNAPLSK